MSDSRITIQSAPFDPAAVEAELRTGNSAVGAVVSFLGLMRDFNAGDQVQAMTLEHYPGMTEKALASIVAEAQTRWELIDLRLVHRVGRLLPTDPIVLVSVASRHRGDAFRACEFIIDYLKTRAPFWKKEEIPGGARWVDAREGDEQAEARWR